MPCRSVRKCCGCIILSTTDISPSMVQIEWKMLTNVQKSPTVQWWRNEKVIWSAQADLDHHQKLITSRGSPVTHACQVWLTSVSTFISYRVYRMADRTITWPPASLPEVIITKCCSFVNWLNTKSLTTILFGPKVFYVVTQKMSARSSANMTSVTICFLVTCNVCAVASQLKSQIWSCALKTVTKLCHSWLRMVCGKRLQLNTCKTEILWFCSAANLWKLSPDELNIRMDRRVVKPVATVRNLRVLIDAELSMRDNL